MCQHGAWHLARTPDSPLRELLLSPSSVPVVPHGLVLGPLVLWDAPRKVGGRVGEVAVHGHFSDRQVGEALGCWAR